MRSGLPQFVRTVDLLEQREVLLNLNFIWKIEVEYLSEKDGKWATLFLATGRSDPKAIRRYSVHFGSQIVRCAFDESSEAFKIIEEIYKSSIG